MKGDLLLTTYPEIPTPLETFTEFKVKLGNGWPGCELGTSTRKIAIWSSEVGYNSLYAAHYYTQSDSSEKIQIQPLINGLDKIVLLNPLSYRVKFGDEIESKRTFGFLANDINNSLPNVTDTAKGIMLVDYQQIIPLLVQAIKEQQNLIDSLLMSDSMAKNTNQNIKIAEQRTDSIKRELNEIKDQIKTCCNLRQNQLTKGSISLSNSKLFQNKPNPFSDKTTIEFEIEENFKSASILIFDMSGQLKKTIGIHEKGRSQTVIRGFEFAPGMYLYSLIVDNKEINTKRMILTQ